MASQPPPKDLEEKKKVTGEDLKKVWSLGPLGEETAKKTFDPAKEWLKDKPDEDKKKGGKKRITRKRRSTKKWTSSATRKRN